MKVVVFCGGDPLQLTAEGQPVPKPMVRLGLQPVLWHVMRSHAACGMDDFVLCLGRGADVIKGYFLGYQEALANDFVLSGSQREVRLLRTDIDRWRITFADTGKQAPVLQRLRTVRPLVEDEAIFCASYGDVLTDAPLDEFLEDFRTRPELAGVLAVRYHDAMRLVDTGPDGRVEAVRGLEQEGRWMAGGYFFFRRGIFDLLGDDDSMLDGLLPRLAAAGQLRAYRHGGFWSGMHSLRDVQQLQAMVEAGTAPWDPRHRTPEDDA
ncbi:MAG TPA: glucose-1-phosphate cytidylyltransferase [Candidatus Limnocylindria bacterium]|nr:glucose-1-phosphate cytidylyltransferase [Candidatus Limnocylindria bacterium]